uniref:Uncharacterized protein n=1 Tax=Megaselia scalaris TaxID=36166 RepID=T1GIW3_MEGSC
MFYPSLPYCLGLNKLGNSRMGLNGLGDLKISKPDLSFITLSKKQDFSIFNCNHKQQAARLIDLFMDAPDRYILASLAAYCKDRINPMLFIYCYTVAIEHRPDTKDIYIPSIVETFPLSFIEPSIFNDAREEAAVINPGNRVIKDIPKNFTSTSLEPEQRLAYFREDIG